MQLETEAIVCALKAHGEHGGVLRLLTPDNGLVACYVRGARGRRMRPVLIAGNLVTAQLRARNETQLPQATVELTRSRAPLLAEPLPAAAVEWVATLIAAALPERQPYPRIYQAVSGFLDAVEASPAAIGWAGALARLELLLVAELGYSRQSEAPAILAGRETNWAEATAALRQSGRHVSRELLSDRAAGIGDARARLMDRLAKAAACSLPDAVPNPTSR